MDIFDGLVSSAKQGAKDKKNDPDKMNNNDYICEYPEEHGLLLLPLIILYLFLPFPGMKPSLRAAIRTSTMA